MKKIIRIAMAFLLSAVMLFSVACNMEEYNYLHDNLDKSNVTNEEFAEWMYNRTKTSIKLSRPNSEIKYNVELLMEYNLELEAYLKTKENEAMENSSRRDHLDVYDMLSPILEQYAKRVNDDKIWVGKTWRDVGRALNMTSNSDFMVYIAKQIMAKGKPVTDYYMYKEIKRSEVVAGEEIVELVEMNYKTKEIERSQVVEGEQILGVIDDYDDDPQTKSDEDIVKVKYNDSNNDTVRVKFKDSAQALKIAQDFIQNAIYSRPATAIGELYVLRNMYEFAVYIGYTDAYVYEEEYMPGEGDDGENEGGIEISRTKIALSTYYQNAYLAYVGA